MPERFSYAGDRVSLIFIAGVLVQYTGYSLAVVASKSTPMWALALGRTGLSGLIFLLLGAFVLRARLSVRAQPVLLGVVAAAMNSASFGAAVTLPLGVSTALEFVGPIALAAVAVRTFRTASMVFAGGVGVAILYLRVGIPQFADTAVLGLFLGLASALFWGGYILLGRSSESVVDRLPSFGIGLMVGAAAGTVFTFACGLGHEWTAITPIGWAQMLLIAVLASVIPYLIDLYCLTRMPAHTFSMLTVSLPAVSALLGWIVLGQPLGWWGLTGLALVIGALLLLRANEPQLESANNPMS